MKYLIFSFIILLSVLQIAYYYPKLPDTVSSHFGASGEADCFMSKKAFCMFEAGLVVFMVILFSGISIMLKYLPGKFINLPNRDYWLGSERSAQTKNYISNWMLVFGGATLIFLLWVFQLAIAANLNGTNKLSMPLFLSSLGIYLAYTTISTIFLVVKFAKIPCNRTDHSSDRI
jgi:uncharacterized membrane protein